MSEILFDVTKVLNNLKNHDYSVADYKMCKQEADLVIHILKLVKADLENDNETTI